MADRFESIPTLVIGVGGTGLKVATYVKKALLEMNRNQTPAGMALMVLDTEKSIRFKAGGWGKERSEHHTTGPVAIEGGEYLALSKNVQPTGLAIKAEQREAAADPSKLRTQPYRHISSWFQATHYLDEANVDVAIWNLDVGAGRYRQFGRLAFFTHIKEIQNLLLSNMNAIRSSGAQKLYVHVAGSLAGGTGAALFADVPHLIKQLAKQAGFDATPVVFGHFVLPEGFTGTPAVQLRASGVRQDFDARCFAALRELTRLQGQSIPQTEGYPIAYQPGGPTILNAKLTDSPYSAVYLYDGVRARNPINVSEIENGLAPAIADAIVAYIDKQSGDSFAAHSVNYKSFYNAFGIETGQPTYGTISTYTVELPIYHITEGWAHQLARTALDTLLEPTERDAGTEVPLKLDGTLPGGTKQDPAGDAENWFVSSLTAVVRQLAEWGKKAEQGQQVRRQVAEEILQRNAAAWQAELAPHDQAWAERVADARMELEGSLKNEKSPKYFVSHDQPGNSAQQKAAAMMTEVEGKLRMMIGETRDVWMRQGGDFRARLAGLAVHHARAFDAALIARMKEDLNGNPNAGTDVLRKRAKLGYVRAFLERVNAILKKSGEVLAESEQQAKTKRKAAFEDLERMRKAAAEEMEKGGGLGGRNFKAYRDRSDNVAQFHKADIARDVVCNGLLSALQVTVEQALAEIRLWERILATAKSNEGGTYALVAAGQREVTADRSRSRNAVRWVIEDDEAGDEYIASKYRQYADGKLDQVLRGVKWEVGKLDGSRGFRIDFKLNEKPWDRQVGAANQEENGQRNVNQLLGACREAFESAWEDMSVVAYLYANYKNKPDELAQKIYDASGFPLATREAPPMNTTFMRVYKAPLGQEELAFLSQVRSGVAGLFKQTTTSEQQAEEQKKYLHDSGEPSFDRFKLSLVMFGDLLMAAQIVDYQKARPEYEAVSGMGSAWKPLHILPAETNALAIEKDLSTGPSDTQQRRRELDDMVVAALEDKLRFQTAMRCLAYGETDHDWGDDFQENGLLLHKFSPEGASGQSYWRLIVQPKGVKHADGRFYDATGQLALPEAYQLTHISPDADADLLRGFVQLVCIGKDISTKRDIPWPEVEETLRSAMDAHTRLWVAGGKLGWTAGAETAAYPRRLGEAQRLACQIIRLNALIRQARTELEKYVWAWKPGFDVDTTLGAEKTRQLQRLMDLWTAVRGTARQELVNLDQRLGQLGKWDRGIPSEKLALEASRAKPPAALPIAQPAASPAKSTAQPPAKAVAPAADGTWVCGCGCTNPLESGFCDECGLPRPEAEPPVVEQPPEPAQPVRGNGTAAQRGAQVDILVAEPVGNKVVEEAKPRPCVNGHEMGPTAKFCPECGGAPRPVAPVAARLCEKGHAMPAGAKFCPECGSVEAVVKARLCENGHDMGPTAKFCPECGKPERPNGPIPRKCVNGHLLDEAAKFCPDCGGAPAA